MECGCRKAENGVNRRRLIERPKHSADIFARGMKRDTLQPRSRYHRGSQRTAISENHPRHTKESNRTGYKNQIRK